VRILIVADCYVPSEKSAAQLVSDLARECARQGHDVTVLVPSETITESFEEDDDAGAKVVRFKVGMIKGAGHVTRAINEMSLSAVAAARCGRMLSRRPRDLIIFYSPSIFFGPLVAWLRRRWRAKSYLVLRDIFPDWAVDAGVLRKGPVYWVFKAFERFQYRVSDVIGVETSRSGEYFAGTDCAGRVELLRNWTALQDPPPPAASLRERLGLEGKTVFVYGGNIGVAQDMDNILRLARRLRERGDVHFLLVGSGSEVDRLQRAIEREARRNVTIHPAVAPETYLAMLSACDVGLISLDRRLKTYSNTGKMLGYMRCGLPILASHNPGNDLSDLLHASGAGLGSINGDDDLFHENALRLCDPGTRRVMGECARRLLRTEFAVERRVAQICGSVVRAAGATPTLAAGSSR
jgi:glycosyltransferase involved in cell wall biosynthesis